MQKVTLGVAAALFVALSFIFWQYIRVLKKYEAESYKNAMLESSLKTQNEAIEKLKLESSEFKAKTQELETQIESKYDNVIQNTQILKIDTCDKAEFARLKKQEAILKNLLKARYENE